MFKSLLNQAIAIIGLLAISLTTASGQACASNPDKIICDDMETYSVGNISPQAAHWIPWDLVDANTNAISAVVSLDFASNGTKSMKVIQNDDQLLKLGNKSTGRYDLKWKMYIPVGKAGYINIQTDELNPGASSANFASEVYFRATGVVDQVSPLPTASKPYPQDTWFPVELLVDLDNDIAKLFVNGQLVRAWAYTQNFGAINFYGADATYTFYVDEVEYVTLPPLVFNADACASAVDISTLFSGAPNVVLTTTPQDLTAATVDPSDPAADTTSCFFEGDQLQNTQWFSFVGDGRLYRIFTSSCGASPIVGNDTQIGLYTGTCGNYTLVDCNDDIDGAAGNLASEITIETVSGTTYYVMIDSYEGLAGTYCLNVTALPNILCPAIAIGTASTTDPYVCFGESVSLTLSAGTVLPTIGPFYGLSWVISSAPLTSGLYPNGTNEPSLIGGNPILDQIYTPTTPNDGTVTFLPPTADYYYTPVVVAGASYAIAGQTNPFTFNTQIDSTGCFIVGNSVKVTFVENNLAPLSATAVTTGGTTPGNITITLTPAGGFPALLGDPSLYIYTWNNGATTKNLTNVPNANYSVTIRDPSGCVPNLVLQNVATVDPKFVQSFILSPNPTMGLVSLQMNLDNAVNAQIEVINSLGQVVSTIQAGRVSAIAENLDLSNVPSGVYNVRVRLDNATAVRSLIVQH